MAPSNTCVTSQLRQFIYYHIDNNLLQNALFFADRLSALDRSSESSYLLSLCHLRLGDNHSAYEYSKPAGLRGTHLGCAYVFAQACLALQRWKDGITALEKSRGLWGGKNNFAKHTQSPRHTYPDAAAVSCLLGKLYCGYDDKNKAVTNFEAALKLNPFMWDAFTTLCDMGTNMHVQNIFKLSPELEAITRADALEHDNSQPQERDTTLSTMHDHAKNRPGARPASVVSEAADPFNNVTTRGLTSGIFSSLGLSQKVNASSPTLSSMPAAEGGGIGPEAIETPTGPSASIDVVTVVPSRRDANAVAAYSLEPPLAPVRKIRTIQGLGMEFGEGLSKMSRAASKSRSQRAPEQVEESAAAQSLRNNNWATGVGERKRTVSGQVVQPRQTSEDPGAPQRRSVRLINQFRPTSNKSSNNSVPLANAAPTVGPNPGRELKKARPPISRITRPGSGTSTVGRQVSGNRKPMEDSMDLDQKEPIKSWAQTIMTSSQRTFESETAKQEEALKFLMEMFRKLGSGYFALSQFRCLEALQFYSSLPRAQQDTPWVMAQMGRAHYEQAAYAEAEVYYKRIRQVAPTRFKDIEIYSTILWHLKRESELAFLAHELIDASWLSPQAWCAIGNSWSLVRDHEQALRAFKRATQLDPKFAYAFTLQGHEHVANEEYDKALTAYRQGMAADKRHYNAWYGVGRVYEKLGNYDKALHHFAAASKINPTNAVLICCI
jgi:anaphase-promoting complex subunit 3